MQRGDSVRSLFASNVSPFLDKKNESQFDLQATQHGSHLNPFQISIFERYSW